MQSITTTQIRTKSKDLVETLRSEGKVYLIHRSRIIGEIQPRREEVKKFDAKKFQKIVEDLNFSPLTDKDIEERYRKAMEAKHGQKLPLNK